MPKLIVNPSTPGRREIALSPGTILTIGRDPTNDLVLSDAMVSRRHAVVERRGGGFVLRDCNSANGSIVNGDRVSERELQDGDLVAIGTARLVFRADLPDSPSGKIVPHPSSVPPRCAQCGAEYRRGDVFCRECGATLAQPLQPPRTVCRSCGTAVPLPARFCSACGQAIAAEPGGVEPPLASRSAGSVAFASAPRVGGQRPSEVVAEAREPATQPRRAAPDFAALPRSEPAEPGSRLAAALVDGVFVLSGQAAMLAPVVWYWWAREVPRSAADVPFLPVLATVVVAPLALLFGAAYHVYFWVVKGATPGKELFSLQVRSEDGRTPIELRRAVLRVFGYALGVASLGIGFLAIAVGDAGLHDRVAGTRVVRVRS